MRKITKKMIMLLTFCMMSMFAVLGCSCGLSNKLESNVNQFLCNHVWGTAIKMQEATCSDEGIEKQSCVLCGFTKTIYLSKTQHEEMAMEEVSPTCVKTGLTGGKKCSMCDYIMEQPTILPQVDHIYSNGFCSVCNIPESETSGETSTEYKVSGTWKFDEVLHEAYLRDEGWIDITFYCEGMKYTYLRCEDVSNDYDTYYGNDDEEFKVYSTYRDVWASESYRTITFDGEQAVSKEFYEWFTTNAKQLITFTIEGTTYEALWGMSWSEWVESEYNTGGFYNNGVGKLMNNNVQYISKSGGLLVIESEVIESGYSYFLYQGSID